MTTQQTLLSSSFTCPWIYSVFLSFRGPDTRNSLTGNLYKALCDKGIKTFIDDEDLRKGEKITPTLVEAIEQSRIAIVIFSGNYASSVFCLEELVKIIELMEKKRCFVLPVFYKVAPSDVRHQKGAFGKAFDELIAKRFKNNTVKVQKWKSALNSAASLSGCHYREGYEYKFISEIIDVISKRITRTPLHVANNPVGLHSHVEKVKTLLQSESNGGVNMVGIYGIGGIGKTTIAYAVHNLIADQFEGVCFLGDIRENSGTKHDLAQLQKKLLVDILRENDIKLGNAKEGITIIKQRLAKKKVLLILDDVNKREQLHTLAGGFDWFGPGSEIIITTRDKHLLDAHSVERKYEVMGLNPEEALKLFSWNAFKKEEVDPNYMDLAMDAISYSNGLPLALEIIGSNLCGRSRDAWKSALLEYRRTLNRNIFDVLKVSYDCLEGYQKKIFLDLACFFKGAHLEYVMNILIRGRDLDARFGIEELVDKSLIKIDQQNRVIIHDLLQDMGRKIVTHDSQDIPLMPGKRSRLWSAKDIIHVLEGAMGSEAIEVMMVNLPCDQMVQWDGYAFKKMMSSQVLIIRSARFSTMIKHLPTSLRLVEWEGYPFSALPCDYSPKNLVTLKMPNGCFILDRPLNNFDSLIHLNLSGNKVLTHVPDISGAPNLEELRLDGCFNLTEIHNSVGIHSKLTVLSAFGCTKLSIFPRCIMMKSLKFLSLLFCPSLKNFPEILGKMENLRDVKLDFSAIEELPFSIQNLVGLQSIGLYGCRRLLRLPSSILTLPKLGNLSIENCSKFYFYNKSTKQGQKQERVSPMLSGERVISLTNCKLNDEFLPTRFPCLSDWVVLRLVSCNFTVLPTSIREFPFLKRLELIACKQLREIRGLPPSLKILTLFKCEQLQVIRELPPNIEVYAANCTSLTSESLGILLRYKFQKVRAKFIIQPGKMIPEWFDHRSKGPSISFWFRKKFPSIALCAIAYTSRPYKSNPRATIALFFNGTREILRSRDLHVEQFKKRHIVLFGLGKLNELIIKDGWNHIEISVTKPDIQEEFVKWMGVYVYKEEISMENISFTMLPPPMRKFDYFEVQDCHSIKSHPSLFGRLDAATLYDDCLTPIIWVAISNMQAPPTIKVFLWEISRHDLTYQSLFHRKSSDVNSPLCPICVEKEETLEHVFLLCPWTRPIWFASEFQWIVDFNSLKCFEVWFCQRLQEIKRVHANFNQVNGLPGCICWAIWNGRNDFVFEGRAVNPMRALNRAQKMHKEYSDLSLVQETILPQFSVSYENCCEVDIPLPSPPKH